MSLFWTKGDSWQLDDKKGQGSRTSGRIEDDDVRRLSPLIHGHLNFLGQYHFSLPSDVRDGELRGLRDPSAGLEEDLLLPEAGA